MTPGLPRDEEEKGPGPGHLREEADSNLLSEMLRPHTRGPQKPCSQESWGTAFRLGCPHSLDLGQHFLDEDLRVTLQTTLQAHLPLGQCALLGDPGHSPKHLAFRGGWQASNVPTQAAAAPSNAGITPILSCPCPHSNHQQSRWAQALQPSLRVSPHLLNTHAHPGPGEPSPCPLPPHRQQDSDRAPLTMCGPRSG